MFAHAFWGEGEGGADLMRVARTRGVLMSGGHEQSSGTVSNDHERYLPTEEPAGIRRTGK